MPLSCVTSVPLSSLHRLQDLFLMYSDGGPPQRDHGGDVLLSRPQLARLILDLLPGVGRSEIVAFQVWKCEGVGVWSPHPRCTDNNLRFSAVLPLSVCILEASTCAALAPFPSHTKAKPS